MIKKTYNSRLRSKSRIRKIISGTADKPRMTVYRSAKEIYVQFIDDAAGRTLVAASSKSKEIEGETNSVKVKGKIAVSKLVGELAAKKAIEKNITTVVFDRNGYQYHGRIKALAEGARESGLKF